MKSKYYTLISNIEKLSEEFDIDFDGEMNDIIHKFTSKQISNNEYTVQILFNRSRAVFFMLDTFNLIERNDKIIIQYLRKTENKINGMPNIIPELLTNEFIFSSNQNQLEIFKELLKGVLNLFSEHKYVDTEFKSLLNTLNNEDNFNF